MCNKVFQTRHRLYGHRIKVHRNLPGNRKRKRNNDDDEEDVVFCDDEDTDKSSGLTFYPCLLCPTSDPESIKWFANSDLKRVYIYYICWKFQLEIMTITMN